MNNGEQGVARAMEQDADAAKDEARHIADFRAGRVPELQALFVKLQSKEAGLGSKLSDEAVAQMLDEHYGIANGGEIV